MMNALEKIEIQKATISNIDDLQIISRDTFYETFAHSTSEENMRYYLENDFSKEQLSKEIEQEHSAFYFAKLENTVIGYLKINYSGAQTELNDQKSLELERIYIGKEYYGKGVGQLLLNFALQIAKQQQMDYVWLGVWEENHRAIQFYLKNGFITFDKHVFMLGDEAQTDFMMKLGLKNIE
jgi:ribosomal protein S18 acetylase RimI-like enzyme